MEELRKTIKEHWDVDYKEIDKNLTLIELAEQIAMDSENCTLEEAYKMYIDNPALHLPGLISFYLVEVMDLDSKKVNAGMTLEQIFTN